MLQLKKLCLPLFLFLILVVPLIWSVNTPGSTLAQTPPPTCTLTVYYRDLDCYIRLNPDTSTKLITLLPRTDTSHALVAVYPFGSQVSITATVYGGLTFGNVRTTVIYPNGTNNVFSTDSVNIALTGNVAVEFVFGVSAPSPSPSPLATPSPTPLPSTSSTLSPSPTSLVTPTAAPSPTPHPSYCTLTVNWDSDFSVTVNGVHLNGSYSGIYPWGSSVALYATYGGSVAGMNVYQWKTVDSNGDHFQQSTGSITITMDDDKTAEPLARKTGWCIIATATYGGPLAPEVVYMRSVRDDMIGSNGVGSVLVDGWNKFYYSWSPPVANAIAGSAFLKSTFTVLLLPLLGIMHITAFQYSFVAPVNIELASVSAFATAALLSIMFYSVLPVGAIVVCYKNKKFLKFKISNLNFLKKKTKQKS